MPRWIFLGGIGVGVGTFVLYNVDQSWSRRERARQFDELRNRFEGRLDASNQYLVSRSIGGLDNDPGITYPAKLHRSNTVSSHQYAGKEIVRKTGIKAQCVSVIRADTEAGPFPGAGDLYLIGDEVVASDVYGLPAIFSGDAATQLRTTRPLDLSAPKSYSVAYIRREHYPPPGATGTRFTDKYSVDQLWTLSALRQYQQHGKHNEVVADLNGSHFCGSFLFLKNPDDAAERRSKEFAILMQRTMHRLCAGSWAIDSRPVVEIQRNAQGHFQMINRDDLASSSLVFQYRHLLGDLPADQREANLASTLKNFYFAKSPAEEKPFTKPTWSTRFLAKFVMISAVGKVPVSSIRRIGREVDELVAKAERDRARKKERFCLYQSVLSQLPVEDHNIFERVKSDASFQKELDFVRQDDKTPYYKLDYTSSKAIFHYNLMLDGRMTSIVINPVGFNQNWRFKAAGTGGLEVRSLKPRVSEVTVSKTE